MMFNLRLKSSRHARQNSLPCENVNDSFGNSLVEMSLISNQTECVVLRLLPSGGGLLHTFLFREISERLGVCSLSNGDTGVRGNSLDGSLH